MKMIEITDSKVHDMSELVEEILLTGGKLMSCLEKLSNETYGERKSNVSRYRMDDNYDERRSGMRYPDYEDMWSEKRYSNRYR